jgi:hypothetical protein
MYIKINGSDFHKEVATFSLDEFKREFEHSFCKGKTEKEIVAVHKELQKTVNQVTDKKDGITKSDKR